MAPTTRLDHLSNALVTSKQLSRLRDGPFLYWTEDAQSIRFVQSELTQAAGVLLRLPQEVIATAIVILQRFWINSDDYEEDNVGWPIWTVFTLRTNICRQNRFPLLQYT